MGSGFEPEAVEWLSRQRFPGNVRELRNLVDRLAGAGVERVDVQSAMRALRGTDDTLDLRGLRERSRSLPWSEIESALTAADGNKADAARRLGISRFALLRRLAQARNLPPPSTNG